MLLSTIIFLPLAGALLVLLAGGRGDRPDREGTVRTLALVVSLVAFAATLFLWWRFNPGDPDFQFVESRTWLPQFGISYRLGVDGISLFLIVLTGFLTPLALLSSWQSVHKNVKLFSFFLLALESAMLGVFVATDLFLFYIFWDAVLIPMYFWLSNRKAADNAARRAGPIYGLLLNKYYIDELYDALVVQPIKFMSLLLWKGADVALIDGSVNGVGSLVTATSNRLRRLQSGSIRAYAASLFVGVVLILGWYLMRVR